MRLTLVAAARGVGSGLPCFPDDGEIAPCSASVALTDAERGARCWRGPERRAAGTATLLGLDGSPFDDLRAWFAGEWTGRRIDAVAETQPEAFSRWRTDPSFAPPGGESLDAFSSRVARSLEAMAEAAVRLVIIADTTVVAATIVHALAATTESFWHLDVPPLSVSRLNRSVGTWRLRSLGTT